jgi:hypothetical protein
VNKLASEAQIPMQKIKKYEKRQQGPPKLNNCTVAKTNHCEVDEISDKEFKNGSNNDN